MGVKVLLVIVPVLMMIAGEILYEWEENRNGKRKK